MKHHSAFSGGVWVALAAAMSSIGGVCFLSVPISSLAANSVRCFLAALLSFYFLKKDRSPFVLSFSTVLGGLCFALTTQFFSLAVPLAGAGISTLLLNTSPFFVLLFSAVFLKKHPQKHQLACLVLVFLGIWLIVKNNISQGSILGVVFGLCSGICYSGIFFAAQGSHAHPASAFFIGQLLGGICSGVFLPSVHWQSVPFSAFVWLGILGIVQLGLSYRCMANGLRLVSPVTAGFICSIEPVLAALWAVLFVGEQLSLSFVLGSGLVLCGILLQQMPLPAILNRSAEKAN